MNGASLWLQVQSRTRTNAAIRCIIVGAVLRPNQGCPDYHGDEQESEGEKSERNEAGISIFELAEGSGTLLPQE